MQLDKKETTLLLGKVLLAIGIRGIIFFYDTPLSTTPLEKTTIYHTADKTIVHKNLDINEEEETTITIDTERTPEEQENIKGSVRKTIQQLTTILSYDSQKINTAINSIKINKRKGTSRGYSSHHNIVINYGDMSAEEFNQVLIHEIGHIIDLGLIEGESSEKNNKFSEFGEFVFAEDDRSLLFYNLSRESEEKKKKGSQKMDFCSIYGMSNPFEDFAECINLYLYHYQYFTLLSKDNPILKKKYNFIASLFGNNYISGGLSFYTKSPQERYRDTTRIEP